MTQRDGDPGREKFEYSEDAMDQWRASKRRAIRPVLVFLPAMVLFGIVHTQAVALLILLVGSVIFWVIIVQNFKIGRRAERRLKAEKQEWEAKHGRPS